MAIVRCKKTFICILFVSMCFSCRKFLDVGEPTDTISAGFVYESNEAATAVLTGVYFDLQNKDNWAQGQFGISIGCGLSADEIGALGLSKYDLQYKNFGSIDYWTKIYSTIYRVNAALEGLSNSSSLSEGLKAQLIGEASFIRAFCYFYLVNLYGDVPLLTQPDYRSNASASRSLSTKVYEQIIIDLETAISNLSGQFTSANAISTSTERVRPTIWVAYALLARVNLFLGDWTNAIINSSKVIDKRELFSMVPLKDVFIKNSKEAIWQLQSVDIDGVFKNTQDAKVFIPLGEFNGEYPLYVSSHLLKAFEQGDKRKESWIKMDSSISTDYNYFYKYKYALIEQDQQEYLMVFRLAEQYLIRAEAKAEKGDIEGAKFDLDVVRERAGLNKTVFLTKPLVLSAIFSERQVELFSEWGHRWFDLKRTKLIDNVMGKITPQKGGTWSSFRALFPIPGGEIRLNSNLTQNEGYPIN